MKEPSFSEKSNIPRVESTQNVYFIGDNIHYRITADRVACNKEDELFLLSGICPGTTVKGIRACLNSNRKVRLSALNMILRRPGESSYRKPDTLNVRAGGYSCCARPLGFGQFHAAFISRTPGFMTNASDEAVWQEVNMPRFTTPVLKEWMPYVRRILEENKLLTSLYGFQCNTARMKAKTKDLDEIIVRGIRNGVLKITPRIKG